MMMFIKFNFTYLSEKKEEINKSGTIHGKEAETANNS